MNYLGYICICIYTILLLLKNITTMAKRTWIFLYNTFLVQTESSFRKALVLFTDTHAKLRNEQTDPDIATMLSYLEPPFLAYVKIYNTWGAVSGTYHGKTQSVEELLANDLPLQLRRWEGKVRSEFIEDSPTEREIFPNKRSPFLSGTYEDRISAIGSLAEKLIDFPQLSAVQAEVNSFYNLMESARLVQQQKEGDLKRLSDLLEAQRVLVAEELHGILGLLIHKYRKNPLNVERYFDLSLLRDTSDGTTPEPEEEPAKEPEKPVEKKPEPEEKPKEDPPKDSN